MEEVRLDLLRRLIAAPSPSGFEQPIQKIIREEVSQFSDEVRTDVHGNVIASVNPQGALRVMLTAHCDELGFLIRSIDDQGFLRFAGIGGFDPSTLPGERVLVQAPSGPLLGIIGRQPVHVLSAEERGKAPKLNDLWIDIGVTNKEEAQQLVPLGTVATRAAELDRLRGDLVVSRALDDKSGIFAVLEAFRRISAKREELQAAVFFASTVQEEVGCRGARTSTYSIQPDVAIAVDVIPTSDVPGASKQELGDIKINGGPTLTMGGNVNSRVYQLLIKAAEEAGLAWQIDPQVCMTWTDLDYIQVVRGPVATGLVNIPCRYLHTGAEVISLKDLEEVTEVLTRFTLALNNETNLIP